MDKPKFKDGTMEILTKIARSNSCPFMDVTDCNLEDGVCPVSIYNNTNQSCKDIARYLINWNL